MSAGTARYMVYDIRSPIVLPPALALAAALSIAACDQGSLGEFETETETEGASESSDTAASTSTASGTTSGAESSTSGASMSTSPTSESTTEGTSSTDTGDPTDTGSTTAGPGGVCDVTDSFACGDGVSCENGDECGALDSYFDDDGCLRPTCRRNDQCGDGEFCYYDSLFGGCSSSGVFCDDTDGECQCGQTDDCGGAYCVPADLLPGGVEAGPTRGWIDDSCAPDDGGALELQLGLAASLCGAEAGEGLYVRMVVYVDNPSIDSGFSLTSEATSPGGYVQISDDGGATPLGDATAALRIFNWGDDTVDGDYEVTVEGGPTYAGSFSVPYCMSDVTCG